MKNNKISHLQLKNKSITVLDETTLLKSQVTIIYTVLLVQLYADNVLILKRIIFK
jgi:hypothetical protein